MGRLYLSTMNALTEEQSLHTDFIPSALGDNTWTTPAQLLQLRKTILNSQLHPRQLMWTNLIVHTIGLTLPLRLTLPMLQMEAFKQESEADRVSNIIQ
jgi:hypothetical protein